MVSDIGPTGTAIVLQRIVPRDGVQSGDLEKLLLQDVFAARFCLFDCLAQNRNWQTMDLHVHLHRSDTLLCARYLKVHIT